VDFILANAIVFNIHWAIKESLAVFNLVDFSNLPNHQNKFYAKFSSYMVYLVVINFSLLLLKLLLLKPLGILHQITTQLASGSILGRSNEHCERGHLAVEDHHTS